MNSSDAKNELFTIIDSLVNEIELTMDHAVIQIKNTSNYIKKIKSNDSEFNNFIKYNVEHLKEYESKFSTIVFSKTKYKTKYLDFLNDITLFNNKLPFVLFTAENKNTKKDLIYYISDIFVLSSILINGESDQELFKKFIDNFKNKKDDQLIEQQIQDLEQQTFTTSNHPSIPLDPSQLADFNVIMKNMSGMNNMDQAAVMETMGMDEATLMKNMGMNDIMKMMETSGSENSGLDGVMKDILGNASLMDMAKDMAKTMAEQKTNPMEMMSSLMSGNIQNSPFEGLINQIKQTVDDKLNSGELNTEVIKKQAQDILKNSGGMMSGMFKNSTGMSASGGGSNKDGLPEITPEMEEYIKNMELNFKKDKKDKK